MGRDVEACEKACQALKIIFDKAFPVEGISTGRRVGNAGAVILTGKRSEAEGHMIVILNSLAVLKGKFIITNNKLLEGPKKAVAELNGDELGMHHYGNGDNVVNHVGGGTQNNSKGGNNNSFANIGTYQAPAPAPAPAPN